VGCSDSFLIDTDADPSSDQYESLLDEYITNPELRDRPALLTRLENSRNPKEGVVTDQAGVFAACTTYFNLYKNKSFCFDDLRLSLKYLDEKHHKDFSNFLTAQIQQESNTQNLLFSLKYDRLIVPDDENDASTLERASIAIELFTFSAAKDTPCPEAGLLAALDLLAIAARNENPRPDYLLRAILVLELCSSKYPDYYPYSILLIQCYSYMGLMSLAMEVFIKLSVKNLQWENVAHIILNRVSTLHPFQSGKGETMLSPSGACEAGLGILDKSTDALNSGIREGLKHGSYSNILDSVQLKNDFRRSVNRRLYALEENKIARLTGDTEAGADSIKPRIQDSDDKRDFSFFPTYTAADERTYKSLTKGPLPNDAWIDAMALTQYLHLYLKSDLSSPSSASDAAAVLLNQFMSLAGPPDRIQTELTEAENRLYVITMIILKVLSKSQFGKNSAAAAADIAAAFHEAKLAEHIEELIDLGKLRLNPQKTESVKGNVSLVGGVKVPGWEYLHSSFVYFEIGSVVKALVGWVLKSAGKGKGNTAKKNPSTSGGGAGVAGTMKEDAERLSKALRDLEDSLKENAKEVKNELGESGVLGRLVDVALPADEGGEGGDDGDAQGNPKASESGRGNETASQTAYAADKSTANSNLIVGENRHDNGDNNENSTANQNENSKSKGNAKTWARFKASLTQLHGGDEALVETLVGRWRESWEDALDGIVQVKVRLGK
jgi:N-acetyltransferase B complex (NatB) non catalytic subunit